MSKKRRAIIEGPSAVVARYLPANYEVVASGTNPDSTLIEGKDVAGWTLDDYVLPRLASGLYFGREVEVA